MVIALFALLVSIEASSTPAKSQPAAAAFERARHLLEARPFEFTAWKRELESVHSADLSFDGAIAWECRRCAILFADSLPADSILQVVETAVLLRQPMALDDSLVAVCDRIGRQPPAMRIARENAPSREPGRRVGEFVHADELPEAITKASPEYPDAAREAKVQGTVMLQVLVGEEGRVRDVQVVKSIPALDAAAIAAVRRWVFKPALSEGRPVAVWVAIPVRFALH